MAVSVIPRPTNNIGKHLCGIYFSMLSFLFLLNWFVLSLPFSIFF